jgi:hypothetical protein
MASGIILGTTSNERIDAKIEWSSKVANDGSNYSDVTATLYFRRNNTGFTTEGTAGNFTITIGGEKTNKYPIHLIIKNEWVKALTATAKVVHDSNGKKSITISATGSLPPSSLTSVSCSGTAVLDTIPRATTLDSLSCATSYFDGKLTYKYTPQSADYYNRINISIKVGSEYIAVKSLLLGKKTASQKTGTEILSADDLAVIYNQLPNTDEGTLRFTLRTYSKSDYTSEIGEPSAKDLELYIPENSSTKPTVDMALTPISNLPSPLNSLYVQGRTKVDANFTNGKGQFGATITSYKLSVSGKTYPSPYTSDYLTTKGTVTVKGIITDSRGFKNEYTEDITVLPYSTPKILPASGESDIICARCDSSGKLSLSGTYLKIKAKRSYSTVTSEGVQKNFCAIRYRHKTAEATSWSTWITLLAKTNTSTNEVESEPLANIVPSTRTSYIVEIGVIDDVGETQSIKIPISTDIVTAHLKKGGKGAAFGKYAEEDELLDVAWNARVRKDLLLGENGLPVADFVVESGVSKGWTYKKWNSGYYEMFGQFDVKPTVAGTAMGSLYYSEQFSLPTPFECANAVVSGTSLSWFVVISGGLASVDGANNIGFRLYRPTAFEAGITIDVRIHASGKLA